MQLGVMHKVAPDDLSPTLAEIGGGLRISLALIAETEEIHQAVRRIKKAAAENPQPRRGSC
jgi:selenocysteine lyase/cysteine desulfurase